MPHGLPCPPVAAMTVCLFAISGIYKWLCPALAADGQLIRYFPSCMSRVRFPSPAPTLCDAIISPQPPVRLRLQAWSSARPEEDRMLALRIVCPLAMLIVLTSGACGHEVEGAAFTHIGR